MTRISALTYWLIASATGLLLTHEARGQSIDFNRDIRPILSDKCFQCHGPDADHREADLRFDVEESAKGDLGGYAAIVPGQPGRSALMERVMSEDEHERMPPPDSGKQLTKADIELLRRWIESGAEWSQAWAYSVPQRHAVPSVKRPQWPANWIDNFLLARLEAEGLEPAADCDRVTLIRRVTFDLIGLPPTPEEVAGFLADRDPRAFEKVVDRLLASDHFGERMAMYWLDLVRYADTVGYHGDQDHNISPYRDYVIDAFNDNLPFDQFTKEQIAGDLLSGAGVDQKIASGYNRLLQTSHEGGVQPKEYLAIYAADRIRNLSAVWMGGTLGCAQCHDHKYDPYTTRDFYSMQAFFADLDEAQHFRRGTNNLPTARPPEIIVLSKRERLRVAKLKAEIAEATAELELRETAGEETAALKEKLEGLTAEQEAIQKTARKTMISVAVEPRPIRILPRGNWLDDSGEVVLPAIPQFLGELETESRATRLDLAEWLTDPGDGVGRLTARVMANRFWYLLFGRGLAPVLDDFGGQGQAPSHPQLLDNLAIEFIEHDWDVKHMMKRIVMSRAYRQSSLESEPLRQRDPLNRLLARQSRFRLPAEVVRDNALAISGLLVRDYGGASVKPYQPAGYYRHLNFPTRKYKADDDKRQWRRGVYVHWQRQFLHPMLRALDAPSREECTAERPRSNTPLAAMTLLNDPTFVEAARVFAERLLRSDESNDEGRFGLAYRLAVSRSPDRIEQQVLKDLLAESLAEYANDLPAAKRLIETGRAPVADDLDVVQLAAWTSVARAILNLSETYTRN